MKPKIDKRKAREGAFKLLCYKHGWTYREVAAALSIPVKAVEEMANYADCQITTFPNKLKNPKKKIIGECLFCDGFIYDDEKPVMFSGDMMHQACFDACEKISGW